MFERRVGAVVWTLAALVVLVPLRGSQPARASCPAPQLAIGKYGALTPVVLRARDSTTVTGRYFVDGCNDTGGGTVSSFGCDDRVEPPPRTPLTQIELTLRQQGRTWVLGTSDADEDLNARWAIVVPADVRPGRATLAAGPSETLVLTIER
jgi:hypothetical protein